MKPAWVGLVLSLSACAPKEIAYQLLIVTTSCDARNEPLDGVQFLQARVTGDGISQPPEVTVAVSAKRLELPEVPSGSNRLIEVRGYDGDPKSGGRVLSMGRSAPLEIPSSIPPRQPAPITVFLRRVTAFSAPVSAGDSRCLTMKVARAGHSATRLRDGKVFIAGGFHLKDGTHDRVALADAELFDPSTGTFEAARDLSLSAAGVSTQLERAYHSATLVPSSGQVALWGGEVYVEGGTAVPRASVLFYDPEVDDYGALPAREREPLARAHHGAAMAGNGRLLVASGLGPSGRALGAVEWLDPASTEYGVLEGVDLPRLDAVVSTARQGALVVVAGGTDGTTLLRDVAAFELSGGAFVAVPTTLSLAAPGRRAAAAAPLRDGADLVLLGGYSDPTRVKSVASTEILSGDAGTVSSGPNIASLGEICAVALPDGRVMAIGGRTADETGGFPSSGAQTVVVTAALHGAVSSLGGPDLPVARWGHTCTALLDGTVLVTGGVNENGAQEVLSDAWIYQPAPLD